MGVRPTGVGGPLVAPFWLSHPLDLNRYRIPLLPGSSWRYSLEFVHPFKNTVAAGNLGYPDQATSNKSSDVFSLYVITTGSLYTSPTIASISGARLLPKMQSMLGSNPPRRHCRLSQSRGTKPDDLYSLDRYECSSTSCASMSVTPHRRRHGGPQKSANRSRPVK